MSKLMCTTSASVAHFKKASQDFAGPGKQLACYAYSVVCKAPRQEHDQVSIHITNKTKTSLEIESVEACDISDEDNLNQDPNFQIEKIKIKNVNKDINAK
ncbi:hypothetical protein HCN44_010979 [Aphidius gifuensis]|uniref:Uncharacterized protein n=1 Tax=Aphidius gifuensis TaxID=684658 RepID=A0A834Y5P8_APHGI|nr:hypothetical protein HCN44_010979 [Aphidius gifuensis]